MKISTLISGIVSLSGYLTKDTFKMRSVSPCIISDVRWDYSRTSGEYGESWGGCWWAMWASEPLRIISRRYSNS